MRIDAHHHFWQYDPVEYDWIDDSMQVIRRSFLPADLKAEMEAAGIDGVVSVQARQSLAETDWLLELASEHAFIQGVVGWFPLADRSIAATLDRYTAADKLKAVRHVVQGESSGFLDGTAFNQGIGELTARGLVYDILIFERQLEETIRFVDRHPEQGFVVDHIAKPRIKENILDPWRAQITELAQRPNVSCKLSGVVTEADFNNWTETQLAPYLDTVLEAFGPHRLMFGTDWPVCLVASRYKQWAALVEGFVQQLSEDEQAAIMGETAQRVYKL
ncbi:amidohydrolase family protein [Coraliomargarita akajimensis]|uniref:Amidohydrolase 2 n=1 Tax=Coraliomargarita akajimensis (strain DSM 45221 / IAM 15411 / JCM 23193 / KCTC 12865 / 04OKA010-24) TaxID=583355 RepID=D5EPK2_CORAD|nr:amidohydrolase family protein [Coraliomargarita akajimensis]ADE53739.1 amidohydrolase 2 [Coraliomargarita akajimensis DSM 45221]